ncbi:MAG: DNA polymerase III subunit alpha [Ignavibacteria bacterium]|nr:DNA polymerase III subunit alpha [Ignavibacteria bacterium]
MPEFIHLHNHTHYSLLDAIATVDGLVEAAAENKMTAVAITDHGNMCGAMEFYKLCKEKKIKPIIGFEGYVAQSGSRFDRGKKKENQEIYEPEIDTDSTDRLTSTNINYAHIVLLAKDETGYRNLIKLNSIGHTEGFYYKPRVDLEILNKYRKGILALSACAGGIISTYINRDDIDTARKMTGIYKDIFGEDFYLEIQNHITIDAEKQVLNVLPKIAKDYGIKLIATNDVHYLKKEHSIAHNIYLHILARQSKNIAPSDITRDLRYGTDQIYFKTSEEMCDLFKDFPEAIKSTLEVSEKCNLNLEIGEPFMPNFPIPEPESVKDLNEYLEKLTYRGLEKKFTVQNTEITDRIRHELEIIKRMDFSGYFLIVQDFINTARSRGILVGPGRGSAAGSLVCYCLGITSVNPLDYNLIFERFLNPERISMPDIDIDFQDDRRDELIEYAKEKYGENSVAQIITFNKLAPRGVLKDVGRVLNFPFQEINDLTKLIPVLFGKIKPLKECMKDVPEFSKYFETGTEEEKINKKNLLEYSMVLENLNKNSSIHASGVVIAPSDVTDFVPIILGDNKVYTTQFDMNKLEDAGLIKIDFLGLKELKVIKKTLDLINRYYDLDLTVEKIPLNDEKTYELFSSGSTTGIFQFSKSKMREYLSKLKPKNIEDLAAMNALYRPGPMKLIPDFIEKRPGKKQISYMHPKMENVLKETYGIIVYQEQVMQIARDIAGFTMAQADNMRKAIGKKIKEKMKQIKEEFVKGAVKNGVAKNTANDIYKLILDFADYGFNKSHAVTYSVLAYYTAYLKTHFPLEFLAVSMECRKGEESELQLLAYECKKMKIKLKPPDVNSSSLDFTIKYYDDKETLQSVSEQTVNMYNNTPVKGEIIYGLSAIKNVGEKAAEEIINEREKNGLFKGFMDFLKRVDLRVVNKKTLESLIFAGAFDEIDSNRNKLYMNCERATLYAQKFKEMPESHGQSGLFSDDISVNGVSDLYLTAYEDFSETEKFNLEKIIVGFYLTGHPLDKYRDIIEKFVNLSFGEDLTETDITKIQPAKMCGVIQDLQIKISKRGNKFAVFNLVDFYGSGECVVFNNLYESKNSLFKNDNLIFAQGRAEENGDKIKLVVEDVFPIENYREMYSKNLTINIFRKNLNENLISGLKEAVEKYPGSCNLFFNIIDNGKSIVYRSRSYKVRPGKELISHLKKLLGDNNLKIN